MAELLDNPIFEEIIQRYITRAEQVITREVEAQGLVMSTEMLRSIRKGTIEQAKGFISGSVHYELLLRLKDVKQLNFSRTPPLTAMIRFVEDVERGTTRRKSQRYRDVGIVKESAYGWAYVPGYPKGVRKLSHEKQVERIAWAVKQVYRREPNVKRGYRGVYNDPLKNYILPQFFHELRQHAGATALSQLRVTFQG